MYEDDLEYYDEFDYRPQQNDGMSIITIIIIIIIIYFLFFKNISQTPTTPSPTTTTTRTDLWRDCILCKDNDLSCSVKRCPEIFNDESIQDKLFIKLDNKFIPIIKDKIYSSCGTCGGGIDTAIYVDDNGVYKKVHNTSMCKTSFNINPRTGEYIPKSSIAICESTSGINRIQDSPAINLYVILFIIIFIIILYILKN